MAVDLALPLRVTVIAPPEGVRIQIQRNRGDLVPPARESKRALRFDFAVRVGRRPNGEPNFLGEFTQGPPDARFVYINSGTLAGQPESCWTRRAKIPLTGITWSLIDEARSTGAALETEIPGTGRGGGPTCASVKGIVWRVSTK